MSKIIQILSVQDEDSKTQIIGLGDDGGLYRVGPYGRWQLFVSGKIPYLSSEPELTDEQLWKSRMRVYLDSNQKSWGEHWGPRPDEPECQVPEEIQNLFNGEKR